MSGPKVLVVDDEASIRDFVKSYLLHAGYEVFEAATGREGLDTFLRVRPDFVVLDLMLPDLTGEEVCQAIRRRSTVPVLLLTAKTQEESKIRGLNLGADDYLTKPFSPRELVARIQAILRRAPGEKPVSPELLQSTDGKILVDLTSREARKEERLLDLTPTEFHLLTLFLERPCQVFSRNQLADQALGPDFDGFDRTVDAHIKNLRRKIETDPKNPEYIETVFGFGYRWSPGVCVDSQDRES